MIGFPFIWAGRRALGIFDDIGNDDDLFADGDAPPSPKGGLWREHDGRALLRAERAGGSATLVRLGAFAGELGLLAPAAREAWALLNLDRIMRRILAAAGLEPADLLPHLIVGAPLRIGLGSDAATARFLLCALLPLVSDHGGIDGTMAGRLLRRLRPARLEDGAAQLWAEEQRAIDEVTAIAREVGQWLGDRMAAVDPLFAVTDVLATYGGALHGFPMDHLPDNSRATLAEMRLESFRQAASLPPLLSLARRSVPEESMIAVFDIGVAMALAKQLAPLPPLTGLIRRDLFRRDLHYPADLGSLIAAIRTSLTAAARDRDLVLAWTGKQSRASARVQGLALTVLTCFESARPSALAALAGTSWQGVEAALVPLERSGIVAREHGVWWLTQQADRAI